MDNEFNEKNVFAGIVFERTIDGKIQKYLNCFTHFIEKGGINLHNTSQHVCIKKILTWLY
jgi:hypothetical protein